MPANPVSQSQGIPNNKAADADLLGETVRMPAPGAPGTDKAEVAADVPAAGAPLWTEPAPAEDENQPGFIGERNRPRP